ncbi:MAG TPA: O-antigen ligase family protein, partial [Candidatus Binatia bacterium]|nr:O-antigen ligase family protein [Candidatus Binatia bacterium]
GVTWRPSALPLLLAAFLAAAFLALGANSDVGRNLVTAGCGAIAVAVAARRQIPAIAPTFLLLAFALPLQAIMQTLAALTGLVPENFAPAAVVADTAALYLAYALFLVAARLALPAMTDVRTMVVALVTIGFLQSAYGALNLLAGNEYLLVFKRLAYHDSATGTLVNRNHFAYVLEMTIPFAVTTAVALLPARYAGAIRAAEEKARAGIVTVAVAVMLLALLLSRSRMGLASLVAAALMMLGCERFLRPAGAAPRALAGRGTLAVLVAITLLFVAGVGVDVAFERFSHATSDLEVGRVPIWRDSWPMVMAHPLFGNGFGGYDSLIASYRDAPSGFSYGNAHCDYLETAIEGGIVAVLVVAAWIIAFVRRLSHAFRTVVSPERRMLIVAAGSAIGSVGLHSMLDFGLRIPAVALTLLAVVAIFIRLTDVEEARPVPRT